MEKKIKYKGFEITVDRLLGYSLYKNNVWCCSDHTIDELKKIVDYLLTLNNKNWEIKYLDVDNNIINTVKLSNCGESKAEITAAKDKPKNAVNYIIAEI